MFWFYTLFLLFLPTPEQIPVANVTLYIEDNVLKAEVAYDPRVYRADCDVYLDLEILAKLHCTDIGMQIRRDHRAFKEKLKKL